jgi:acyl-homoserine lactone acylase PvdQ
MSKGRVETATYVVDRQKAVGRFRTLPWSTAFEVQRQAMGQGIDNLWKAWDESDEEFQFTYRQARAAVSEFMDAIGAHVLRHGAHR